MRKWTLDLSDIFIFSIMENVISLRQTQDIMD